jgi:hypothetical protein
MSDDAQEQPRITFREHTDVRQEPGRKRRWFNAPDIELVVWNDSAVPQAEFQLIYWLPDGERALTWRNRGGFNNCRVDPGDESPFKNESPILHPDGVVPWPYLEGLFRQRAESLDPDLRQHILGRLQARR